MLNVIFGASSAGFDFLRSSKNLEFNYFVDNDKNKIGKKYFGLKVISVDELIHLDAKVYVCSAFSDEIIFQLDDLGFRKATIEVVNSSNVSWTELNFPNLGAAQLFLRECTDNLIDFVVIRNYKAILSSEIQGDIDILVQDRFIKEFIRLADNYTSDHGIKMDVCSVYGTVGYRYNNMPLFPVNIANQMLDNKRSWKGIFVCDDYSQLVNLMYYCVVIKGEESKIPWLDTGNGIIINNVMSDKQTTNYYRHNYLEDINVLHTKLFGYGDFTSLLQLKERLTELGFFPRFDLYRKVITSDKVADDLKDADIEYQNCKLLAEKYKLNAKNNRHLLLFVRSRFYKKKFQNFLEGWLSENSADIKLKFYKKLTDTEIDQCKKYVRGANWEDNYGEKLNGFPVAILVLQNLNPVEVQKFQKSYFPFEIIDNTYFVKERLRADLRSKFPKEKGLNPFHSTDDDIEMILYLDMLGINLEDVFCKRGVVNVYGAK
jgi:hypothetical protein